MHRPDGLVDTVGGVDEDSDGEDGDAHSRDEAQLDMRPVHAAHQLGRTVVEVDEAAVGEDRRRVGGDGERPEDEEDGAHPGLRDERVVA